MSSHSRLPARRAVSVVLLYVKPASPAKVDASLNCTCVSDPPGVAEPALTSILLVVGLT